MGPILASVFAAVLTAAESAPQPIAVLDVLDHRDSKLRPAGNAVQRAFEEVLTEGKKYQLVARKPGQNAACKDDDCRIKFARELQVDRVLATRIEFEHGECLVHATIFNTANKLPEVIAYRSTTCDQPSVLAIVKNELGPALRKEHASQAVARPKLKLVPLSDRRIVGSWDIKHVGAKQGTPPNLTGAQLKFGADGQYRGEGKVFFDRGEEGFLSISGPYGFDGRVLGVRNWGTEFENCEVLKKKPASFTPSAINESEFSQQSTCKMYFEGANKIWVWYPGPSEGVILDTWTRASK